MDSKEPLRFVRYQLIMMELHPSDLKDYDMHMLKIERIKSEV